MATETAQGSAQAKLEQLAELLKSQPAFAAEQLRAHLKDDPLSTRAYRLLAAALGGLAQSGSGHGEIRSGVSGSGMKLMQADRALQSGDLPTAEIILRPRLREAPNDVNALRLMAILASKLGFQTEAEELLLLALEIAPDFVAAQFALAAVFEKQNRPADAALAMDDVLARYPDNYAALAIKAGALEHAGRFEESLKLYEVLVERSPDEPRLWSSYGLALKTVGRSEEGRQAMRRAVKVLPQAGEAWWNLSNLKTERLDDDDVATMAAALESGEATDDDRLHLHFALGKALEDRGDAKGAFDHYAEGNRIRLAQLNHEPDDVTGEVSLSRQFFTREFFEERVDGGSSARDPIFIVGMPRAGSTLIEQILASHSQVEGTTELPEIGFLAKRLGRRQGNYFPKLAELTPQERRALGEEYIELTRPHRVEGRPMFIDKMPNNWVHIPLIQLILPNAAIIDARRHPLACGFSNFKQHFVRGQAFSYDLTWMGRYYSDYVRMLAHIDNVLPGRVHRVIHEQLVADTENEIRRLLDYVKLPFEESCLRFYETKRAVRTPSSEQVRRPISTRGVDQWRQFEPWLEPLKTALGPVLDSYPEVPNFPSS